MVQVFWFGMTRTPLYTPTDYHLLEFTSALAHPIKFEMDSNDDLDMVFPLQLLGWFFMTLCLGIWWLRFFGSRDSVFASLSREEEEEEEELANWNLLYGNLLLRYDKMVSFYCCYSVIGTGSYWNWILTLENWRKLWLQYCPDLEEKERRKKTTIQNLWCSFGKPCVWGRNAYSPYLYWRQWRRAKGLFQCDGLFERSIWMSNLYCCWKMVCTLEYGMCGDAKQWCKC